MTKERKQPPANMEQEERALTKRAELIETGLNGARENVESALGEK